jgi:UDP-N-acetylmuramate--alanine ligase
VLHERGVAVTGSDLKESLYSRALTAAGVPVTIGHDASNLGDPGVVVVSSAIPERNPELVEARVRGIEVWPRARMLAELAEQRRTIAVAGTHGKTSTSSMVATMLDGMGLDPTFLIGGEVDRFRTNARNGSGEHYVVEADESDGSFVHLDPFVSLVTNIEPDHLDHYASLDEIEATFTEFMCRTNPLGALVVCADDERLSQLARECGRTVMTYGFSDVSDVRVIEAHREGPGHAFTVEVGDSVVRCSSSVPGIHMVLNATGALAVAAALGLDLGRAAEALASFTGVRRRFDHLGTEAGVTVVDDYAHHPTEVKATLEAASGLDYGRVWVIFQPHRYSRTSAFAREFGGAFGHADKVVLMDVYSAGETPVPGVSGKTVVNSVLEAFPRSDVAFLPHRADVVPFVTSRLRAGDLVLTMGAGDVTTLGPEILAALSDTPESRGARG